MLQANMPFDLAPCLKISLIKNGPHLPFLLACLNVKARRGVPLTACGFT